MCIRDSLLFRQIVVKQRTRDMHFSESLKKNRDFRTVYRDGRSYANRLLVMYTLKNDSDRNRLGISVSKKVGNSVVRHHITRLVRESYRLHEEMFHSGWDLSLIHIIFCTDDHDFFFDHTKQFFLICQDCF